MQLIVIFFLLLQGVCFAGTYYDPAELGLLTPPTTNGTTYHVSTTGDDSKDGLSEANAWKTFAHAFDRYHDRGGAHGCRILIHAGTYHESILIPENSAWTRGSSYADGIIVSAAGDGEVIIDKSVTYDLGSWSVYSGSIYKATFQTLTPSNIQAVVIDGDFYSYHPKTSLANVTSEGDWYYDSSTHTIYLYVLSAKGSPSDDDVIVVEYGSADNYDVKLNSGANSYVTIYGLTLRGNKDDGIYTYQGSSTKYEYLRVEHCLVEFNGKAGLMLSDISNGLISKNKVYGNILRNWPRGSWPTNCADISAGGWPAAVGGSTSDNVTISGNIITDNGGEGSLFYKGAGNCIWEDNIVGNNWSTQLYTDNQPNGIFRRNFVYHLRTMTSADIRESCTAGAETEAVQKKMIGTGIMTADEDYGVGANYTGGKIYNNLILALKEGISHYGEAVGSGVKNTKVYENTIILPDSDPSTYGTVWSGIKYTYNSGNNSGSEVKNNIIIGNNGGYGALVRWLHSGDPDDGGIVWNNNIYYHPNNATPFTYKDSDYNFTDWKTQTNEDANSKNQDPGLSRSDWSGYK